jgi:hypothetical protein
MTRQTTHRDERDELDDEAEARDADREDKRAAEDGERAGNLRFRHARLEGRDLGDDVADDGRQDGDGADSDAAGAMMSVEL